MASLIFTIAQLAEAANMTIDDVRAYEDFGLLPPLRRRPGRTDDVAYREEHFDRLMFIKSALDSGFAIDDIRQLVDPVSLVPAAIFTALQSADWNTSAAERMRPWQVGWKSYWQF